MIKKLCSIFSCVSVECLCVCLYFICLPFTIVSTPFGSLLKLITMPVVGILSYKLFIGERKKLAFNSVQLIYSLYMVYVVLGLFMYRSEIAVTHTKDMLLAYFVLMLVSVRVYNRNERELIETSWVVVGIVCTYLCLTSTEVANEFENRTIVYVFGFAEDPNQFCAYFIMPVMVCMKRIVEKRKTLPFYIVLILLILYSVLKTGSRGGLIGILIGIFVCIMLAVKSFKGKVAIMLVTLLCALVVIFVVFPLLPEDIQMRYDISSVVEDNAAGRFDTWKYLLVYASEKPSRLIYGSGLLSTYEILADANLEVGSGAAHNQYVQVLNDQGILGFIIFFAFICVCFFRNIRKQPYYSCAFVAVLAFSMSLTLYVFKPYINIIMMCAMSFEDLHALKGRNVPNDNPQESV